MTIQYHKMFTLSEVTVYGVCDNCDVPTSYLLPLRHVWYTTVKTNIKSGESLDQCGTDQYADV